MNTQEMKGRWKELKGKAKARWGKLTDDDLTQVEGRAEELTGKIQARYGVARDEARRQVDEFCSAC